MTINANILPAAASRVGTVCGPCQSPKDNAGTVLCHITNRWGSHAVVLMDDGHVETCHGLTDRGIGWYAL